MPVVDRHYEGGHRVPAFIGGPALPAPMRGAWYNGTLHLVDLHATLLDLGGAVASQPKGVVPIDGVSIVSVLNGSVGLEAPLRTELWIADEVLRVGDYKLITGGGASSTSCMLGIGGLPVKAANNPASLATTCGTDRCHGNETGADAEICHGCKCHGYNASDPQCMPCLYDVHQDPGEQKNLAASMPAKVAEMTARIQELAKGTAAPQYPPSDLAAACSAMVNAGGFYVPWA